MRHLMPFDYAPDSIRSRIIRRSFVQDGGCTERECAENQPGPHHPAHIGEPEHHFAGPQIEQMSHILRPFEGKAGMIMNRAFGFASRTGGINKHEWIHALHWLRLEVIGGGALLGRFVPSDHSASAKSLIHAAYGDDCLNASSASCGLASMVSQPHYLASAIEGVSGN